MSVVPIEQRQSSVYAYDHVAHFSFTVVHLTNFLFGVDVDLWHQDVQSPINWTFWIASDCFWHWLPCLRRRRRHLVFIRNRSATLAQQTENSAVVITMRRNICHTHSFVSAFYPVTVWPGTCLPGWRHRPRLRQCSSSSPFSHAHTAFPVIALVLLVHPCV